MQLFTSIYADCHLLPHFLDHYSSLGVSRVVALVNVAAQPDLLERVRQHAASHDLVVGAVIEEDFDAPRTYAALERLKERHCVPTEWVFVADLDEFVELPEPLDALIRRCENSGADYVRGLLVDRISADGSFPALDGRPIGVQFPLAADLTTNLLCACPTKVPLMRATCPIQTGLHATRGVPLPAPVLRVHHYKWTDRVIERAHDRLLMNLKRGDRFWFEPDCFLRYISGRSGIDVNDPRWNVRVA
jgi:hypothetical protein